MHRFLVAVTLPFLATPPAEAQVSYQLLPSPSGSASAVSADGTVVWLRAGTSVADWGPAYWSAETGVVPIDLGLNLGPELPLDADRAGYTVVGNAGFIGASAQRGFVWSRETGTTVLESPWGAKTSAHGISSDGRFIVGAASGGPLPEVAMRWDRAGTPMPLGGFTTGRSTTAFAVSADGRVVVGMGAQPAQWPLAFRWTEAGGFQDLGGLGGNWSVASDCSSDGNVVVGGSRLPNGEFQAFRWTPATGMQSLGSVPGALYSNATKVSGNGHVIAGLYSPGPGLTERPFIWEESTGMVSLPGIGNDDVLIQAISEDGSVLVGRSRTPQVSFVPFRWEAGDGSLGRKYGRAALNSSGTAASIFATGSSFAQINAVTLRADRLPPGELAYFMTSRSARTMIPPGAAGPVLLGDSIGRFTAPGQVQVADSNGAIALALDLSALPLPTTNVAVLAGESWFFQCWFQDGASSAGSGLTDGLRVTFQ